MPAAEYNFEIEQGTTVSRTFVYRASGAQPIDLTGYAARMQVRKSVKSSDVLLEASTDNGRIVLGGVNGTVQLDLSATVTAALAFKSGVYDLELEDASGRVTRLLEGSMQVSPEVTR